MALPSNVSFFMQRLAGVSVSHFKISPQSSDTAGANKILRFELPSNSLLNLSSVRLLFNASADKTSAAGGRLPNGVYKLIERVAIYAGGTLIQNNFQSYGLYATAKEVMEGSKCDAVLGHPEIVRNVSYHDGSTFATTANEKYDDEDDKFAITHFEGLLSSLSPTIIDTGICPQLTVEICLAEDTVCSSCAGPDLDGTGATDITDAATPKATYELTNLSMQVEVLGMASDVLDSITEQRIASVGFVSCPFTNVFTYVSTHKGTSRFSVNSASWDRVWLCYREATYADKAGAHRVPGFKKSGAFASTASGSYTAAVDVGAPGFDVGGSLDTNREKYISKYFRCKEPLTTGKVATYQLQINGATVPAYKCNRNEMYAITRNSVDPYHMNYHMTLAQYVDSFFIQCFRFCLPESSMSRLASGIDTRSISAQAAVETSGLDDCNLTVFAECTSELRIGSGRAVSVIT